MLKFELNIADRKTLANRMEELTGILSVTYYDKEDDEDGAGFDEGNL